MTAKYNVGQKVKIVTLIDGFGRTDPLIQQHVNETGTVVKSYCISKDEIWEKMLKLEDVDCYDVRLDNDGTILPGIPEVALEPYLSWRS